MAIITPIKNGLHSLAKGLESFNTFHDNPEDVFALKDAVLRTHQAVETISKSVLYQINPVFVLKDDFKVGNFIKRIKEYVEKSNSFLVDEESTIGLRSALERLRNIGLLEKFPGGEKFPDREFFQLLDATEDLEKYRNALQHFAIEANVDEIARIIGNVVPRFIDLLDVLSDSTSSVNNYRYSSTDLRLKIDDVYGYKNTLNEIYPNSEAVIDLLRSNYDQLIRNAIDFFSEREFQDTELRIKVVSYGRRGGSDTDMPHLVTTGVVDLNIEWSILSELRMPLEMRWNPEGKRLSPVTSYNSSVDISNPVVIDIGTKLPEPYSAVSGKVSFDASVSLQGMESVIHLPEADEHIRMFQNAEINITISMDYQALAHYSSHYSVERIINLSGILDLTIKANPRGYSPENNKHLILGSLKFDLDKDNAPFTLSSFVEPDGSLRENHSFEGIINVKSMLKFSK